MNQITTLFPAAETHHPAAIADHLCPEVWAIVNRFLVRKALSEYAHELIVHPEKTGIASDDVYTQFRLPVEDGTIEYRFDAQLMALRHWRIPAQSIVKYKNGQQVALDALSFIIEIRGLLGISEDRLPIYLDEISSTLYGAAYKFTHELSSSATLAQADYQTIEVCMTEGHPCFVANNGRLGFDAHDYQAYAPEAATPVHVIWLAVHKSNTHFSSVSGLDYDRLLEEELGTATIEKFTDALHRQAVDPEDYYLMPAHPWQWFNKLSIAFAAYVATKKIICLGYGEDRYLAQQSIRTFFNTDQPGKRYVKTSLSILNMGFMRGLSPYYMSGTPAINEYLHTLIQNDPFLRSNGFQILREVASLGFRNHYYEAAIAADTPYKKMFSALWRENPVPQLPAQQRLMTMAALLHVDRHGHALVAELIAASGLETSAWLERYVDAYLIPLVHCLYEHDLVFMPHGENLILVIEQCVPVRVFMKDIAEESSILNKDADLPENVRRLLADVPDHFRLLTIFVDVFDGFFRHLSALLVEHGCCSEDEFWRIVAQRIDVYQQAHPGNEAKYRRHDLYAPEIIHSCLNRLQLANNLQMVNLSDPIGSFRMAPNLINPIAACRPARMAGASGATGLHARR